MAFALGAARLVSTPSRRTLVRRTWLGIATCEDSPTLSSSTSPVSRSALKLCSSPLRLPISPRPLMGAVYRLGSRFDQENSLSASPRLSHPSYRGFLLIGTLVDGRTGPAHLDRSGAFTGLIWDREIAFLEKRDQLDVLFHKKRIGRSFLPIDDHQRALDDTAWMLAQQIFDRYVD